MKHLRVWDKYIKNNRGRKGRICLLTGRPGADVHHIDGRDFKEADELENLMALAPDVHEWFGQKKQYKAFLYQVQQHFFDTGECLYQYDPFHPFLFEYLEKTRTSLYFY